MADSDGEQPQLGGMVSPRGSRSPQDPLLNESNSPVNVLITSITLRVFRVESLHF